MSGLFVLAAAGVSLHAAFIVGLITTLVHFS